MKSLIMIGASGHAKVCVEILEKQNRYRLIGFLDRKKSIGSTHHGYPILGTDQAIVSIANQHQEATFFIAIGSNFLRQSMAFQVKQQLPSATFASLIHPSATIARQTMLGIGSVVMPNANIGPDSRVGDFCILNTQSSLDHDSVMLDGSALAPGVCTGGHCQVGARSFVGIGARVKHGVVIGEDSVIGAGATVVTDIPAGSIAMGTPARVVGRRDKTDGYL